MLGGCAETLQEEESIKEASCAWSWNRRGMRKGRKQEKEAEEVILGEEKGGG